MVQMKAFFKPITNSKMEVLYIPHGSDERDIEMPQVFFHPRLYIPHGSDESLIAVASSSA